MSKTTDSLSSTCVLCCQGIKIYAVGQCNHHICFKCSTKMRVICNQMYCAVCRTEMLKVIFTNKLHPFEGIISHKFPHDRKFGIFFASSRIQDEYRKALAHRCQVCGIKRPPDNTFKQLQDHMRRDHELFACQLCVDHVQILSCERKFYTRKELAQHRRTGDPDETSYRGHPNCQFCDERYFDNDELMRHLRKDHFYCHFCESDGITNEYFAEYPDLADHFRTDHFLCEEDACHGVEFTNAFRTEIDLKAHKARAHGGKMTKLQARQTRQVEVEVNLPARPTTHGRGRRDGAYGGRGRGGRDRHRYDRSGRDTERAIEASLDSAHREEADREEKREQARAKKQRDDRRRARAEEERGAPSTENLASMNEAGTARETGEESETLREAFSRPEPYTESAAVAPNVGDFPTLGGISDAPSQMGGRWSAAPPRNTEDFPALGNGDDGSTNVPLSVAASFGFYTSKLSNKGPLSTQPVEPAHQPTQAVDGDEEFPTLSSIASLLGVSQKNVSKSKKKKKHVSQEKTPNEPINSSTKSFSSMVEDKKSTENGIEPEKVASKPVEKLCIPPKMQSAEILQSSSSALSSSSTVPVSRPPPGFTGLSQNTLSSSLVHPPPGFTPFVAPSAEPDFVPPPRFKERNRDLVHRIQDFCGGDAELFGHFKQDSGEFRQGAITAGEYYRRCTLTLSEENFAQIFDELVSLLPDVGRQQQLLQAHKDHKVAMAAQQPKRDAVLKISEGKSGKKKPTVAWQQTSGGSRPGGSLCPVCSQMVLAGDLPNHMNAHEDFPALASSSVLRRPVGVVNKTWGGASWGKGK